MFTTRPELRGTFGMVASTHWLASATAMGVLERGGNAFDAAVAGGFALQVVEPHLNGPGGDMPALVYSRRADRVDVICGQGPAPAAATIGAFRDLGLDMVPGSGLLPAVVPGAFDAWLTMLQQYGTWSLPDVLAPAIGYARDGFPLVPRISAAIATVRELFETHWPSSAAIYLADGAVPEAGRLFANRVLADTYERIAAEAARAGGRDAGIEAARTSWHSGWVADAIDRFSRGTAVMDVTGTAHRGLLTGDDMARWRAGVERPLSYDYGRFTVFKCGPWSQGPVLLQQLALLKGFHLDGGDPTGPDFVHTVVECAKLAFADREAFYGDPDFVDVPVEALLSDGYADSRRALISDAASLALQPGAMDGYAGRMAGISAAPSAAALAAAGVGEPTVSRAGEPTLSRAGEARGDTVHIDVVDREGNMVSATPSGGWLQSSPVIPELGFCLGTRGQMFWLEEGLPASLAPGKRPRTTLTPSMAFRDGSPYMAFGTPGGDQQDQWQTLFFLHHAHHEMNLQEAIDCPAFHTEHFPSSFYPRQSLPGRVVLEGGFTAATLAELRRRGHDVVEGEAWSEGRLSAAAREPDGLLKAGANPRGMQGYAVGR